MAVVSNTNTFAILKLALFFTYSVNNVLSRSVLMEYQTSKDVFIGDMKLDLDHPTLLLQLQGYVFCQDTLSGSPPLPGVTVRVECDIKEESKILAQDVTTNQNGNFTILLPKEYAEYCKVYIVSSPVENCSSPTNLNGGVNGTHFSHQNNITTADIGPFSFEPKKSGNKPIAIAGIAHPTGFPFFCDFLCNFNCGCCTCTYTDDGRCKQCS